MGIVRRSRWYFLFVQINWLRRSKKVFAFLGVLYATQDPTCVAQTNPNSTQQAEKQIKPETSHIEFVTEYIRELTAIERIRAAGEEENNQSTKAGKPPFAGLIHTATMFDLELHSQIRRLSDMRLSPPSDYLIPALIDFYEQKLTLWQRMSEIGSAFMAGPKEGVDYGQLGAEVPKLRARLEYVDQSIFEATPGVFATLINTTKADSKGHVSHLIITKAEKQELLTKLNDSFGAKLDQKNQNYIVSSAIVLRDYLHKDFKCADEPWQ